MSISCYIFPNVVVSCHVRRACTFPRTQYSGFRLCYHPFNDSFITSTSSSCTALQSYSTTLILPSHPLTGSFNVFASRQPAQPTLVTVPIAYFSTIYIDIPQVMLRLVRFTAFVHCSFINSLPSYDFLHRHNIRYQRFTAIRNCCTPIDAASPPFAHPSLPFSSFWCLDFYFNALLPCTKD